MNDMEFVMKQAVDEEQRVLKLRDLNAELVEALRVVRATLPHMDGNTMSTNSLLARIDAALVKAGAL